jgi:hypothetical protein
VLHTKDLSELNSVLRDAAKAGNMQGVLSALELGTHFTCLNGTRVRKLTQKTLVGADVSSKGDDSSLTTPLHWAAVGGHRYAHVC